MLLSQGAVLGCAGLRFALIGDPYIWFAVKSSGGRGLCRAVLGSVWPYKAVMH